MNGLGDGLPTSDAEWRERLTPEQYAVLREGASEPAFSGCYWNTFKRGTYCCAGCGQALFHSRTKFLSRCGWPSFEAPIADGRVSVEPGDPPPEIRCLTCDGHLGNLFHDAPTESGLRYCVNSAALSLVEDEPILV